jgi:hypothetical protein
MTDTAFPHLQRATAHPPFSRRRYAPGAMLHCPSCHLGLRQRHPQMTIDYCPRCIARARQLVQLMPAPERAAGARSSPAPLAAA